MEAAIAALGYEYSSTVLYELRSDGGLAEVLRGECGA